MANITASATGGNWSATTAWNGGVVPVAGDNVFLASGSGNIVVNGAQACNDLDCTGYTGSLTGSSGALTVNGNLKLVAGMTFTVAGFTGITFAGTSTGLTVDFSSKSCPALSFTGIGGEWTLLNNLAPTSAGVALNHTGGKIITGSFTIGSTQRFQYNASGTNVRALDLSNGRFNFQTLWDITNSTNFTYTDNSSTIIQSAASASVTFNGGGLTYNDVRFNNPNSVVIAQANTFANLQTTFSNTGATADNFCNFSADQTITTLWTLSGNASAIYRFMFRSNTEGTQRTINVAAISNGGGTYQMNFRDINITGAASPLPFSTQLIGDCGGNSGITFPTGGTAYWVSGTGSASTASLWRTSSGGATAFGRVPLPQDTMRFDANSFTAASQTFTLDVYAIGSIDWTGVTNNPTWAKNVTNGTQSYGDTILSSGMTDTGTVSYQIKGRRTNVFTCNGRNFAGSTIVAGLSSIILQQGDNYTSSSNVSASSNAIWDNNGFTISCVTINPSAGGTIQGSGNAITCTTFQPATNGIINCPNAAVTCTTFSASSTGSVVTIASCAASGATTVSSGASVTVSGNYSTGTNSTWGSGSLTVGGSYTVGSVAPSISTGFVGTLGSIISSQNLTVVTGATVNFGAGASTCAAFSETGGTVTGAPGGSLTCSSTWAVTGGSWSSDTFNVSATTFTSNLTTTRSVTRAGNDVWTASAFGSPWNFSGSGLTYTRGTGQIILSNTSASAKTFTGSGFTYETLRVNGASGNGTTTISAGNRFKELLFDPYASILFTSGSTTTLDNPPMWVGASGQNIVISATTATASTISTTGTPACDYLTLSRSTITGPTVSYAGANSTNGGTNTGWTFSAAPNVFNDSITETVTATQTFAAAFTMRATMTETVAATDAVVPAATYRPTITESATAGQTFTSAATFTASFTESAAATDAMSVNNTIARSITETAAAGDSMIGLVSFDYFFTETVAATDAITGGLLFNATITETVAASDSVTASKTINESMTETIAAIDTDDAGAIYQTAITETAEATDIIIGGVVQTAAFTETIAASDDMTATKSYDYFITETVTASDLMQVQAEFNASFLSLAIASDAMLVKGPKTTPDAKISGIALDLILISGVW